MPAVDYREVCVERSVDDFYRNYDEYKRSSFDFGIIKAMQRGRIIKLLGGFYTVRADSGEVIETRARGNFRQKGIKPLVGDFVDFAPANSLPNSGNDNAHQTAAVGYILALQPRENQLVRPALANIDQMVVVMSTVVPNFSCNLLDRFLAYLEYQKIRPLIYVTKLDLITAHSSEGFRISDFEAFKNNYKSIGYQWLTEPSQLLSALTDKVTVFMGQTGVGKTTLLNRLAPEMADLATNTVSEKLGRGRHTTRHVELFEVAGGLVADTPGFSSLTIGIDNQPDLNRTFIDIFSFSVDCKFRECSHTHEPDCAVKKAVESGEILRSRYDTYLQVLSEINHTREVYIKRAKKQ